MCWIIINSILRLVLTAMMVIAIVGFEHWWTRIERTGMGMIGGAVFVTIPVIMADGDATPFDGWASSLSAAGMVVFFFGLLRRKHRHDKANRVAVREAADYMASRNARS